MGEYMTPLRPSRDRIPPSGYAIEHLRISSTLSCYMNSIDPSLLTSQHDNADHSPQALAALISHNHNGSSCRQRRTQARGMLTRLGALEHWPGAHTDLDLVQSSGAARVPYAHPHLLCLDLKANCMIQAVEERSI